MPTPLLFLFVNNVSVLITLRVELRLKFIYQRECKTFIGKEKKPDLDGKTHFFSVQRTGDQLVKTKDYVYHIMFQHEYIYIHVLKVI